MARSPRHPSPSTLTPRHPVTLSPSFAARRRIEGWLLVLPAILLILGLTIFPLIQSLGLSFQRWDLQSQEHPFVGVQNYRDALIDPRVWGALQNTAIIVVCAVTLEFLLGLGLALLFTGDFAGKRIAMPILMLPVMVVPIVVGLTWRMLWDNQYGAINQTLSWIAGREVNILWLAHRDTALFAMIVTDLWQWTPFMFLVLLAGLSSVNPELYEAAALDGAGWWESLRDVSLPGIARVIAVASLFRALDAFKVFDLVYMFTKGGPGTSTESISWYIYELGFKFFRLGYASAVSFLILILLTVLATLYVGRFLRGAET
jgi:multiple sugar transport system permease protein